MRRDFHMGECNVLWVITALIHACTESNTTSPAVTNQGCQALNQANANTPQYAATKPMD